jgi:hypothetical protein
MSQIIKYFIVTILFLGLTNCSSSFFTLTPDETSKLEQGRELIEKEDSFAYSWISFEDYTDEEFVFHVFAYNIEQEDFIFDPSMISVKFYDKSKKLLNHNDINAIDPERQINKLDLAIKERDNSHDVSTGLNVAFALLSTIVDLTDGEDNNAEEVLENVVVFADNQISEEVSYENDLDFLKANKAYWKNEVLRKTELSKEEGIDGVVYIPFNKEAKYVKILFPIGKTVHTFRFQQIEH